MQPFDLKSGAAYEGPPAPTATSTPAPQIDVGDTGISTASAVGSPDFNVTRPAAPQMTAQTSTYSDKDKAFLKALKQQGVPMEEAFSRLKAVKDNLASEESPQQQEAPGLLSWLGNGGLSKMYNTPSKPTILDTAQGPGDVAVELGKNLLEGAKKTVVEPLQGIARPAAKAIVAPAALAVDFATEKANQLGAALSGTEATPGTNAFEHLDKDPMVTGLFGGSVAPKDFLDWAGASAETALNVLTAGKGAEATVAMPTVKDLIKLGMKYGFGYGVAQGAQNTKNAEGQDASTSERIGNIVKGGIEGAVQGAVLTPILGKGLQLGSKFTESPIPTKENPELMSKLEQDISPKLSPREQQRAILEGRVTKGKESFLGGKQPDVIEAPANVKRAAQTVKNKIPDFAKLDEYQLPTRLTEEIDKIATQLKPEMQKVPVSREQATQIQDRWKELKIAQSKDANLSTVPGFKALQKEFDAFVGEIKNPVRGEKGSFRQKNLDDVWDLAKRYDESVPDNIKKANEGSPSDLQFKREIWVQNRGILRDLIKSQSGGLGDVAKKSFGDMSDLYTARTNLSGKTRIDIKGTPGLINKKKIRDYGKDAILAMLFGSGIVSTYKALTN